MLMKIWICDHGTTLDSVLILDSQSQQDSV